MSILLCVWKLVTVLCNKEHLHPQFPEAVMKLCFNTDTKLVVITGWLLSRMPNLPKAINTNACLVDLKKNFTNRMELKFKIFCCVRGDIQTPLINTATQLNKLPFP